VGSRQILCLKAVRSAIGSESSLDEHFLVFGGGFKSYLLFFGFNMFAVATASAACRPWAPGVSSSLIDLDGALQVLVKIAGGVSTVACGPVDAVDLENADIVGSIGVVVLSMGVAAALVCDNALATGLVPVVLGAPGINALVAGSLWALASTTIIAGAVATASISDGDSYESGKGKNFVH
jgi:hypothetical protein